VRLHFLHVDERCAPQLASLEEELRSSAGASRGGAALERLPQVGQDAYEHTDGSLATHMLEGHTDTVAALAFNAQGTHLATGGMDGGWWAR